MMIGFVKAEKKNDLEEIKKIILEERNTNIYKVNSLKKR